MTLKKNKKNMPATAQDKRVANQQPDDGVTAAEVFKVSTGVLGNAAILYGSTISALGKLTSLLDELNSVANQSTSFCRGAKPDTNLEDESFNPDDSSCLDKLTLYKKSKDGDELIGGDTGLEQIKSLISLLEDLTKPYQFGKECVNPYFEEFFNAIPFQFLMAYYIRQLLKKLNDTLSETEIEQIVREIDPCGAELTTILKQNVDLDFPKLFPLFKLPPIPLLPQVNLYTVLKRLIMELVCAGICAALAPLVKKLTKIMLEITDGLVEDNLENQGTLTELLGPSLGKINLNDVLDNSHLRETIRMYKVGGLLDAKKTAIGPAPKGATKNKLGLWKSPSKEEDDKAYTALTILIRDYFNEIFKFSKDYKRQKLNIKTKKYEFIDDTRELGTKELSYLFLGEYVCTTIEDLIEIGQKSKYSVLKLDTEKRIVEFFKFIGKFIDLFDLIGELKECPVDPCEIIDNQVKDEVGAYLSEICKVLNMSTGLPPIPINNILSTIGMDSLFKQGVKAQFQQLKNDYLLLYGFPSMKSFPEVQDLNPMLPNENGDIEDYDLWNNNLSKIPNQIVFDFFTEYMLNGGPPLQWKYDDYDISKNLEDQTLADVCGDDEIFEVTYAHALYDLFEIDEDFLIKLEEQLDYKKQQYAKEYEKKINDILCARDENLCKKEKPQPQPQPKEEPTTNPCCKFENFTHTRKSSGFPTYDILVFGPADSNNPEEEKLVEKLHKLWAAVAGAGTDTILLKSVLNSLTDEERCYVCRRTAFVDGNSILADIESDTQYGIDGLYSILKCGDFGYPKGGAVKGHKKKSGSFIDALVKGKCPKE